MQEWRATKQTEGWKAIQQYWLEVWKTREQFEEDLHLEKKGY